MRFTVTRCPGCGRMAGINGNDIHKRPATAEGLDVTPTPALTGGRRPASRRSPERSVAGGVPDPRAAAGERSLGL